MKKLTYGLGISAATALLLTACGGPETPPQDACQLPARSGEQAGIICGTVTGTTANKVTPLDQIVKGPEFEAAVRQNGEFEMVLPAATVVENNYKADLIPVRDIFGLCESLNVTPETGLKVVNLSALKNEAGTQLEAVEKAADGVSNTYTYWWYADRDATVTVTGKCFGLGNITNQVLPLKKGWNVVKLTTDLNKSSYAVSAPTATRYTFKPQSMSAQSLVPNFHTPWLNLDKYKNRR